MEVCWSDRGRGAGPLCCERSRGAGPAPDSGGVSRPGVRRIFRDPRPLSAVRSIPGEQKRSRGHTGSDKSSRSRDTPHDRGRQELQALLRPAGLRRRSHQESRFRHDRRGAGTNPRGLRRESGQHPEERAGHRAEHARGHAFAEAAAGDPGPRVSGAGEDRPAAAGAPRSTTAWWMSR